jgi:hypothetical protein
MREAFGPKRKRGRTLSRWQLGLISRISKKVGAFGFACKLVMGYGCGIFSPTLIPDTSKPTATWGLKTMG